MNRGEVPIYSKLLQRHTLPQKPAWRIIWLGCMSTICDRSSQGQEHSFCQINNCIGCSVSHRAALWSSRLQSGVCTSVRKAVHNKTVSSLIKGVSASCRHSEYYTTPEQFQRNLAMAKGWYKQSHAMHRASAAGVAPYTAIDQSLAVPPMFPNLRD